MTAIPTRYGWSWTCPRDDCAGYGSRLPSKEAAERLELDGAA